MFKHINVDYDFSKILSADYSQHTGSPIEYLPRDLADVYEKIGPLPTTYVQDNTTIHQLWWDEDQLDYQTLGKQLQMEIVSVSSIMQPPGNCIPYHRDSFYKISIKHPNRIGLKVRANIFLEDGDIGHLLQFTLDNKHKTIADWKANTGYMFDSSILHLSVNAGMKPKYTLQISGFYLGQEQ
jgi:hypothetical protein